MTDKRSEAKYTFKRCRKRLAALWIGFFGLMFAILVAQSLLGALGGKVVQAWGWFLANTMPTISVIIADVVADADPEKKAGTADAAVEPFYYWLSAAVSAFYLLILLVVILGWRLTEFEEPADAMAFSAVFTAPAQAVAVGLIAIFFKKAAVAKPAAPERPKPDDDRPER